eukprot:641536-Rhodomonas_salina.1
MVSGTDLAYGATPNSSSSRYWHSACYYAGTHVIGTNLVYAPTQARDQTAHVLRTGIAYGRHVIKLLMVSGPLYKPPCDRYDSVSVLFADIVGFTKMSSNMTPQQVPPRYGVCEVPRRPRVDPTYLRVGARVLRRYRVGTAEELSEPRLHALQNHSISGNLALVLVAKWRYSSQSDAISGKVTLFLAKGRYFWQSDAILGKVLVDMLNDVFRCAPLSAFAMSGTDIAYGAICLRAYYALSGTDLLR